MYTGRILERPPRAARLTTPGQAGPLPPAAPASGRRAGRRSRLVILCRLLAVLAWCALPSPAGSGAEPTGLGRFLTGSSFPPHADWADLVPAVRQARIPAGRPGETQPALILDSGSEQPKPLLLALHSWSNDYAHRLSIPFALFAQANDWVFLQPDFGGPNLGPRTTGSAQSLQDIAAAARWAVEQHRVDPARIVLIGYSGGGMAALSAVGERPDLYAAAAVFGPVFDLPDFWAWSARFPHRRYAAQIAAACGGAPRPGTRAFAECGRRSPASRLERARDGRARLLIVAGLQDDIVPPSQAGRAFNVLAEPADRLAEEDLRALDAGRPPASTVPPEASDPALAGRFAQAGQPLLFLRSSGKAALALFNGGHDLIFDAGLAWLFRQVEPSSEDDGKER